MSKRITNKFWLLMIALLTATVLAACSGGDDSSEGDSEGGDDASGTSQLTAWAWDPNFNIAALELAKENYDAEGFELEIIENAQDDIVQKLNTGLSSGTMKGMPNIVLIEDQRAQSFLQSYPDAFYPIGDYFNTEDFASYKIAPTSLDGKQYGLPFDTGATGFFYRTDYLEEAGYTQDDLTNITWAKFVEIAKNVKEKTGHPMLALDPNDLGILRVMMQTTGTWYTNEDGEINLLDNEPLKLALTHYKELMSNDLVQLVSDWSQYLAAFNSGDVASVPAGNWIAASVEAEESQSGKWRVAPTPRLDMEGAKNASNQGGSSWYVLNIDGKEAAAEFLGKTFGSNTDFYQSLVEDVGALGTYTPASEGDAYQFENEFFNNQQVVYDFSQWMEEIPQVDYGMNTYGIEDILAAEIQQYLNGKSLEDVLADAQAQAENQFK
ncbi:ABC transporter substrate-binding protein [Gracilibacillus caseinilyticus]|uniref:ABC transporter substrate-binding protein n=1 Tax=Gracilibacillus caseinilyticus TaxID=2932256 RepID=A0ABY4F1P4_9BACI|nr:ABC transporter substrate-binding protein [Gracilibacillus caseinilyticus]UOQ50082.1 ABC transporter substrate-binding protein [Gracilibacillus caseinilyticus]